jgi:hypothetical protein
MKPKTQLHKRVLELGHSLSFLTPEQKKWGIENNRNYSYQRYKTVYCLECGHSQKVTTYFRDTQRIIKCKKCKKETQVINYVNRPTYDFGVFDTKEEFQIIRTFRVQKLYKVGKKVKYHVFEVAQNWISTKGKITYVSKKKKHFSYDVYEHSPLEIKLFKGSQCTFLQADVYPYLNIHPELEKRGFYGEWGRNNLDEFISQVFVNPKYEILLKNGYGHILSRAYKLDRYWPQIRIAMRHDYEIESYSLWTDYIDLLEFAGKDIRSPKYLFPKNLRKEHDKYLKRKRKAQLKEKLEEERAFNPQYLKRISKFENLIIDHEGIKIVPLKSVDDFFNEEIKMHHCVFTNAYYKESDLLVLTSSIDDKPLETIAYDLKAKRVYQAYGACNQKTEHHDTIVSVVETQLPKLLKKHKQ